MIAYLWLMVQVVVLGWALILTVMSVVIFLLSGLNFETVKAFWKDIFHGDV